MSRSRYFFRRALFKLRQMSWAKRVDSARRVLAGDQAWQAMDRMGIPGFGTELLRLDFLSDASNVPAWDSTSAVYARLAAIIDHDAVPQAARFAQILAHGGVLGTWPAAKMRESELPWLENEFLSPLDMVALYGTVRESAPEHYVEIGSGVSTRVALAAVSDGGLRTQITCFDPQPRVDLPALKVEHRPLKLESALEQVIRLATPGSILFFDGSHRSFPGSDVTMFFMEVLPALQPGVLIHIHDIFLPEDYPSDRRTRYWSEQYLLASWLLGGTRGLEILLPGARLETRTDTSAAIPRPLRPAAASNTRFSSFWMRKL